VANPAKVRRPVHHPALDYNAMGEFMAKLRACEGNAARALEFTVLTAARSGEAVGAVWAEFDLDAALWTVPAHRMKAGRLHKVPLSAAALSVVQAMHAQQAEIRGEPPSADQAVFRAVRAPKPLSVMAMPKMMQRLGYHGQATIHGMRSSFRDWAVEKTLYPPELAEMALAHLVGDSSERAYRRTDMFECRRRLLEDWAEFIEQGASQRKVVSFARG
jgi:integrase